MSTNRHSRAPVFFIKLHAADYSWPGKALQNAFGGTSSLPLPRVSKEWVCCSAVTEREQRIRIGAYRGHVDKPFELPVCEQCAASRERFST